MSLFSSPKRNFLLIISVAAITLLLSSVISIWLSEVTSLKIPSIGKIQTIGVEAYWDESLKNKTETINWNKIWLGSSKNVTIYLRSISNVETIIQINATNWTPSNFSKYMNLSWNYDGTPINPNEVIIVTITLSAPKSIGFIEYLVINSVKEFSFDMVIRAIE